MSIKRRALKAFLLLKPVEIWKMINFLPILFHIIFIDFSIKILRVLQTSFPSNKVILILTSTLTESSFPQRPSSAPILLPFFLPLVFITRTNVPCHFLRLSWKARETPRRPSPPSCTCKLIKLVIAKVVSS